MPRLESSTLRAMPLGPKLKLGSRARLHQKVPFIRLLRRLLQTVPYVKDSSKVRVVEGPWKGFPKRSRQLSRQRVLIRNSCEPLQAVSSHNRDGTVSSSVASSARMPKYPVHITACNEIAPHKCTASTLTVIGAGTILSIPSSGGSCCAFSLFAQLAVNNSSRLISLCHDMVAVPQVVAIKAR